MRWMSLVTLWACAPAPLVETLAPDPPGRDVPAPPDLTDDGAADAAPRPEGGGSTDPNAPPGPGQAPGPSTPVDTSTTSTPGRLVPSADGTRIYAVDPDREGLLVFDLVAETSQVVPVGLEPTRIVRHGTEVFVTLREEGAIAVLDEVTDGLTLRDVVPVGTEPVGLAWAAATDQLIVALSLENAVVSLDPTTLEEQARWHVSGEPTWVLSAPGVHPDTTAWVATRSSPHLVHLQHTGETVCLRRREPHRCRGLRRVVRRSHPRGRQHLHRGPRLPQLPGGGAGLRSSRRHLRRPGRRALRPRRLRRRLHSPRPHGRRRVRRDARRLLEPGRRAGGLRDPRGALSRRRGTGLGPRRLQRRLLARRVHHRRLARLLPPAELPSLPRRAGGLPGPERLLLGRLGERARVAGGLRRQLLQRQPGSAGRQRLRPGALLPRDSRRGRRRRLRLARSRLHRRHAVRTGDTGLRLHLPVRRVGAGGRSLRHQPVVRLSDRRAAGLLHGSPLPRRGLHRRGGLRRHLRRPPARGRRHL